MRQLDFKTKRAIQKHSLACCLIAFDLNEDGNGASTIAERMQVTTNQADAMINAGADYTSNGRLDVKYHNLFLFDTDSKTWFFEFGDFDRDVAEGERECAIDSGYRVKDAKVVTNYDYKDKTAMSVMQAQLNELNKGK